MYTKEEKYLSNNSSTKCIQYIEKNRHISWIAWDKVERDERIKLTNPLESKRFCEQMCYGKSTRLKGALIYCWARVRERQKLKMIHPYAVHVVWQTSSISTKRENKFYWKKYKQKNDSLDNCAKKQKQKATTASNLTADTKGAIRYKRFPNKKKKKTEEKTTKSIKNKLKHILNILIVEWTE